MYSIKQFNNEATIFERTHKQRPTTAHLSEQQVIDIVNGERMRQGKQPMYSQVPSIRHINGVEIRVCKWPLLGGDVIAADGPHFSGLIE